MAPLATALNAMGLVAARATNETAGNVGVESTETSTDLLNDRISLVAATTLLGVTYGIITMLYLMTTYSLVKKLSRRRNAINTTVNGNGARIPSGPRSNPLRSKIERRMCIFYVVYTSILFVLATMYTAVNAQNAIIAYVDNRMYPGGPYQYYVMFMAGMPVMITADVISAIILWMTDALILCRFIVFYYKIPCARWIIPLPCILFVGVIVFSSLELHREIVLEKIFYLSENVVFTFYVLSFSLNVLATVLIAIRLYWHKVQLERVFGPRIGSPYTSMATLLIECAALYGTWSAVFLILYLLNSPGQTLVLATMSHIQVIAPMLIILWTARGKAWDKPSSYGEDEEGNEDEEKPGEWRYEEPYENRGGKDRCRMCGRNGGMGYMGERGDRNRCDMNEVDDGASARTITNAGLGHHNLGRGRFARVVRLESEVGAEFEYGSGSGMGTAGLDDDCTGANASCSTVVVAGGSDMELGDDSADKRSPTGSFPSSGVKHETECKAGG